MKTNLIRKEDIHISVKYEKGKGNVTKCGQKSAMGFKWTEKINDITCINCREILVKTSNNSIEILERGFNG